MDDKELVRVAFEASKTSLILTQRMPTGAAAMDAAGNVWAAGSIEAAHGQIGQSAEFTVIAMALTNATQSVKKVAIARQGLKAIDCDLGAIELLKQHCANTVVLIAASEEDYSEWQVSALLP